VLRAKAGGERWGIGPGAWRAAFLLGIVWYGAVAPPAVTIAAQESSITCPVTLANMQQPPGDRWGRPHGNGVLWTELTSTGQALIKPERDGSIRWKVPWWRRNAGTLEIAGRRLDAEGTLRAIVPRGYGKTGFQSSRVIFSSPGCWEITGRVGQDRLSFVVDVRLKS